VDGALRFRGVVEWGFKAPDVLALLDHARRWSRPSSPFAGAPRMRSVTWVEPRLEVEVSYAEIVEGRLRAPSWRGLARGDNDVAAPAYCPPASQQNLARLDHRW
jgi:ATP-dependent DNA ligase